MKKIFKKIFNLNTGYFVNPVPYDWEGKTYTGYTVCQGYILFGIPGYSRVGFFVDKEDADGHMEIWQNLDPVC